MHNVAWSVGSISPGQSAHLFVARSGCGLCKCRAVICDVCRVRGLRLWGSRLVRDGQLDALGTMIGIPHIFYNETVKLLNIFYEYIIIIISQRFIMF